jgi:phage/plasmid-associated DNA primase
VMEGVLGLEGVQQFQRELHDGLLHPLEYGPCFAGDLYRAYQIWAGRNGIKNPRPSNMFSQSP